MEKDKQKKSTRRLWAQIMAWVLSILMMGSMLTLTITMLLNR